ERRCLAEMLGQEVEKEREVAPIGGDGVRRGAAFAAEPAGPQSDRRAQIVGCGKARQRQRRGEGGKTLKSLSAPGGGEGRGEVGDSRALAETHLTLPIAVAIGSLPLRPEGRRGAFRAAPRL